MHTPGRKALPLRHLGGLRPMRVMALSYAVLISAGLIYLCVLALMAR
jgi:hypothetical protein